MALGRSCIFLLSISCLLFSVSTSEAQSSFKPKPLVLPLSKDPTTLQHIAQINQRTPLVPVKLTVDLGGKYLWVDCEQGYVSSSYKPARCGSAQCSLAKSRTCNNNTCELLPDNTVTRTVSVGDLGQDVVTIQSTDGRVAKVANFLLSCGTNLAEGLAKGVVGMAGLGRDKISITSQFSDAFSLDSKFAICLSSSKGVVFFGDGPYFLGPKIDVSKSLIYTPLIFNKISTGSASFFKGDASSDYFIRVKSIKINGKFKVPLNTNLLKIDKRGSGGTKISTTQPYTVLETSIHKALTDAFAQQISNKVPRVAAFAPFDLCFDSTKIGSTRVGPAVPRIDLVLHRSSVVWSIFGANSMVQVKKGVLCLGFVDGGLNPRTSIIIGGHQLEDNLLQFDVAKSRFGFSSSLLFRQTSCANFNFTSKA